VIPEDEVQYVDVQFLKEHGATPAQRTTSKVPAITNLLS
jgi:hypothetical protein